MNEARPGQQQSAFKVAVLVVGLAVLLLLLWHTRHLVLTVFLGVLFALAVGSGVDRLQRYRVPRGLAAPLIVLAFLGVLGAFGTWIGPTVRTQSRELKVKLPEAIGKLEAWIQSRGGGVIATITGLDDGTSKSPSAPGDSITVVVPNEGEQSQSLRDRLLAQLGGATRFFLPVLSSTLAVGAGLVLIIFLAIYLAIDPGLYRRGLIRVVPKQSRARADKMLTSIAGTLRKWLVTQLIAMVVIGVITTLVLLALNVRAAIPLG